MGELEAFLKIHRAKAPYRDAEKRRHDYEEILGVLPEHVLAEQGARCMDCGVPFCHNGCPLGDRVLDRLDRHRVVVDVEHARRLTRRRADPARQLGEVVRRVQRGDR